MNRIARWMFAALVVTVLLGTPIGLAHSLVPVLQPGKEAPATPRLPADGHSGRQPYADSEFQPTAAAQAGYRIWMECNNLPRPQGNEVENATNSRCPMDVRDPEDILSQPILMVDPKEPNFMAFNAMHGGRGVDSTPTNISRNNFLHQPHTTYYVPFQDWEDNPYYSPLEPHGDRQNVEDLPNFLQTVQVTGRRVFGEDNAAATDAQGRVYLASLYLYKDEGQSEFKSAFAFFKGQRINRAVDYKSNKIHKFEGGEFVSSPHMVYVRAVDRVVTVWLERNATDPSQKYINLAWTVPAKGNVWTFLRPNQRIGPCAGMTNPLDLHGEIYIGCLADKGYRHSPNATIGQLQIHAIDARGDRFTQRYVDEVYGIEATATKFNVILGYMYNNRMFLIQGGLSLANKPIVRMTMSGQDVTGAAWDQPQGYEGRLASRLGVEGVVRPEGVEIQDSRIMAAAFVKRSGNFHGIYKERWKYPEDQPLPQGAPEYYKALFSIHADGQRELLGIRNLDVDRGFDPSSPPNTQFCQPYSAAYQGSGRSIFNDFKDSIVTWENKVGHQREFIAFGDSGCVRVAEVFEENFAPFGIPLPPGVPPIPVSAPGINPAQIGVLAGALTGAMVLRMLAMKRKLAVEAPA